MDIQDQMLVQYFVFLKETELDESVRNEKIVKAVNDYYLGKGL